MRGQSRSRRDGTLGRRRAHPGGLAIILAAAYGCDAPSELAPVRPNDPHQITGALAAHIERFAAAIEQSPEEAARHAELGLIYEANQLWPEARDAFAIAHRLAPDRPLPHLHLAIATLELGRFDDGLALVESLVTAQPEFAPGLHRLGLLNLDRGDTAAAEDAFRRLVTLAPSQAAAHVGLADALLRSGRAEEALSSLQRALELAPSDGTARHLLGLTYRALGRRAEAERELKRAHSRGQRGFPDEWSNRLHQHAKTLTNQTRWAKTFIAAGRYDDAIRLLDEALVEHPDNTDLLSNYATVRMRQRRLDAALELLERARTLDPSDQTVLANIATCHYLAGDSTSALAAIDEALAQAAPSAALLRKRASYLRKLARPDDAVASARQAVALDPQNPRGRLQLAELELDVGEVEAARAAFDAAAQLDPSLVAAHLGLARLALDRGDVAAAEAALAGARGDAAGDPRIDALAGELARRRGAGP